MIAPLEPSNLPGLLPHHAAELRASGLSDETIKATGIYSESRYGLLAATLGWNKFPPKMAPAIVFPFVDAEGRNGYARIKPDRPRIVGGKPIKYESPRGQPNRVYLPPGVASKLADPVAELLITEGEKKAIKTTQEGFACIGLVGVWGWKDGKGERLLAELERVAWRGRPVRIAFDSDGARNDQVRDAEARLAAMLANRGAAVRVVRLPDGPIGADGQPVKMGLDDFLVAQGPGELRKLLDNAQEPEPLDPVSMKAEARTLDPATEAESFLQTGMEDGVPRLRFWRDDFWLWEGSRYAPRNLSEIRAQLITHLNRTYSRLTANITNNCVDQLRAAALLDYNLDPPEWLGEPQASSDGSPWRVNEVLATRSALVYLPGFVANDDCRVAPTPRFFTTAALDYDFAEDAPPADHWLAFLHELWPDDPASIATLQEWFGYCLTADTRLHKILLLVGPKRSGKSTIGRVLRATIGEANVAGPTLASLATNFGLWPLLGKSLAIVSDARLGGRADQAPIVERLLSISGEDPLTVDRKYGEPVTAKLSTRVMILSNELPRLNDTSGALAGRMILLPLEKSFFGSEDSDLTEKLLAERPAILLWAIEGWKRLRERGRFLQPQSGLDLLDELNDLSSPVGAFVAEQCVVEPNYEARVESLFVGWKKWCERNGRQQPGTAQSFGRDLRAAVPSIRVRQVRDGEGRFRAYQGIDLRP